MRFAGRRVFVTGAATGIGRATADYLARRGRRASSAPASTATPGATSPPPAARSCTSARPTSPSTPRSAPPSPTPPSSLGGLDAVVNCAGIYPTGKRLEEVTDADWDRTIAVNLTAIFRVCRAALPLLRAAGGGSVVNIASVHADATVPGVPAYAATKAAVVGLSPADGARLCGRPHPGERRPRRLGRDPDDPRWPRGRRRRRGGRPHLREEPHRPHRRSARDRHRDRLPASPTTPRSSPAAPCRWTAGC